MLGQAHVAGRVVRRAEQLRDVHDLPEDGALDLELDVVVRANVVVLEEQLLEPLVEGWMHMVHKGAKSGHRRYFELSGGEPASLLVFEDRRDVESDMLEFQMHQSQ